MNVIPLIKSGVPVDLQRRVDWVLEHRKGLAPKGGEWTLGAWCKRAGLRRTHLHTMLTRATEPDARQEVQTMVKLAEAAKVSVCWFTFGTGFPEERAGIPTPVMAARAMAQSMRFASTFLATWEPPASDDLDADTVWTLIKADYQRWRIARAG